MLNDGSTTRRDRGSGLESTPDVSLAHEDVAGTCNWTVHRKLSSDHYPIVVEVGTRAEKVQKAKVYAWNWKNADWLRYREEVELRLGVPGIQDESKVFTLEEEVRKAILFAARKHIGLKVLRTANGEVLNQEVRAEADKRDELRDSGAPCEEVKEQEGKLKEAVRKSRTDL